MKKREMNKLLLGGAVASLFGGTSLALAQSSPAIIGKNNEWLFVNYEYFTPADTPDVSTTVQLLQRTNKLFESKGITLALVVTPSKIRIHQEFLPASNPMDAFTNENYDKIVKELRGGGVNVVDLNKAFLASPHRNSDTPIFLRLDTHWSQTGAYTAAETIRNEIQSNPKLKTAYAATPEVKFSMAWSEKKVNQRARDIVKMLPAGSPSFPPEQAMNFKVTRDDGAKAGLTGAGENVGILVIGSSYTNRATGYPDGIRHTLQRELLDISIPVDQGPWVGMDSYLKDDAFKTNKPKLIIWEIPEREFRAPPSYKFRDPRYHYDNNGWFDKISASLK